MCRCRNGGSCVVRTDGQPDCKCPDNYSGQNCEVRRDRTKGGASSSPSAVVVPLLLIVIVILCSMALYIYYHRKRGE